LTLAFLGPVEAESIPMVERAAGEVRSTAATLVLDHPGFWRHNRIAWAGASVVPLELERLVIELRKALSRSRVQFDPKAFAAHVTLLRDAREPRAMPELEPIAWDLDGFALLRSRQRPGGSGYEILNSWKLET
jgi:2'-5' RNA ligase